MVEIQSGLSPRELVIIGPANNNLREGQRIRYTLAQNSAAGVTANSLSSAFGAESSRSLAPRQWLDLETGRLARMPRSVSAGDSPETGNIAGGSAGFDFKQAMAWAGQEGVDLTMDAGTNHPPGLVQLVSFGMKVIPLTREDWTNMTSASLADELRAAMPLPSEKAEPGCVIFGSDHLPATYGFETSKGQKGILQIRGYTFESATDPRTVRTVVIRYKLAETGSATRTNAAVTPELLSEPPKL